MLEQDAHVRRHSSVSGCASARFPTDIESLFAEVEQVVTELRRDKRLEPVARLIETAHSDPCRHMHHYCEAVGMSRRGFRKRLQRITGLRYTELLACYRLTRAAKLFPGPAGTISRAAEDAGFPNYRAFSLSCERLLGMTPRALKNKLRKS